MKKVPTELLKMYQKVDAKTKGGQRTCPHCGSREWWQTPTQGRQCDNCFKIF